MPLEVNLKERRTAITTTVKKCDGYLSTGVCVATLVGNYDAGVRDLPRTTANAVVTTHLGSFCYDDAVWNNFCDTHDWAYLPDCDHNDHYRVDDF